MKNLKFKLIRAQNVLCFGAEGIEINFKDYEAITHIQGINLDAPSNEDNPASNGAGKSSVAELLSIGLFGKTIKSPTKCKGDSIINVLATKGEVEIQWDDMRVLRNYRRNKNGSIVSTLQVWRNVDEVWDDVTKGSSIFDSQKYVEEQIGLSHHAFCNVVIFDDSNNYCFLESDSATKRQIIENLLDLDQYRQYHQNVKDQIKVFRESISTLTKEYETALSEVDACNRRIVTVEQQVVNWRSGKQRDIDDLLLTLNLKKKSLGATSPNDKLLNWQKSQDRIALLTTENSELEDKRLKITAALKIARTKLDSTREDKQEYANLVQIQKNALENEKSQLTNNLKSIENLQTFREGEKCIRCHGIISRQNYGYVLAEAITESDKLKISIEDQGIKFEQNKESLAKKVAALTLMEQKIAEADGKLQKLTNTLNKNRQEITILHKINKPEMNLDEKIVEMEITELEKRLETKKQEIGGESPYEEILRQSIIEKDLKISEKDSKASALKQSEGELPYYEFWLEAFGDNGIRKFVVDGVIPSLNERISYWLQILIDGLIEVKFDNKLDVTINRNGNPAKYHNMSNGERRRINLAVSQAFAYVMILSCGNCPSLVFLDEITGGGIDRAGTSGIYNMIFELGKERQVFVTTHNENLLSLLHGCRTICLKKQDDITVLDLSQN